jgi:3-keto-5-aminohexanoate cleavage enzyme
VSSSSARPVIIEVALNGSRRKASNPNVPVSVAELTADALACLAAGAQIVHQHDDLGRPGELGGATPAQMAAQAAEFYRALYALVPDALVYPTSNWPGDIEARWSHQTLLAQAGLLRMAYVDPGSVNIGAIGGDGRPQLAGSLLYTHSYADIAWMMAQCQTLGLAPNMAIFEPGFLRVVRGYEAAGALPRGAFVKLYFSERLAFGFPPTRLALDAYRSLLEGSRLPWAVAVLGGDVLASGMARWALEAGGHLRVGLEDYAGADQPSNLELVEAAVSLCLALGRPIATRAQTAQILDLASSPLARA